MTDRYMEEARRILRGYVPRFVELEERIASALRAEAAKGRGKSAKPDLYQDFSLHGKAGESKVVPKPKPEGGGE